MSSLIADKFYWGASYAAIQLNGYSTSVAIINDVTKIAKNDFPGLEDLDIEVKICASRWRNRMPLIMFRIPQGCKVPADYTIISPDSQDLSTF